MSLSGTRNQVSRQLSVYRVALSLDNRRKETTIHAGNILWWGVSFFIGCWVTSMKCSAETGGQRVNACLEMVHFNTQINFNT